MKYFALFASIFLLLGCNSGGGAPDTVTGTVTPDQLVYQVQVPNRSKLGLPAGDQMVQLGDAPSDVVSAYSKPSGHRIYEITELPVALANANLGIAGWDCDIAGIGVISESNRAVLILRTKLVGSQSEVDDLVSQFQAKFRFDLIQKLTRKYQRWLFECGNERLMVQAETKGQNIQVTLALGLIPFMNAIGATMPPGSGKDIRILPNLLAKSGQANSSPPESTNSSEGQTDTQTNTTAGITPQFTTTVPVNESAADESKTQPVSPTGVKKGTQKARRN